MNTKQTKLKGVQSGVAGEYFVAAEMSRRGYITTLTLRNTRGIDILAANPKSTRSVGIQVKTRQGSGHQWMLTEKSEKFAAKNHFYVFVNLRNLDEHPDFYVVPSNTVARAIKKSHRLWLKTPGKKGQLHKDNPVRVFDDHEERYRNQWKLLRLG